MERVSKALLGAWAKLNLEKHCNAELREMSERQKITDFEQPN